MRRFDHLESAFVAGCVALASITVGCASRPRGPSLGPSGTGGPAATPAVWVSPARLFVLPDESGVSYQSTDKDGVRRLIAHGMRLVEHGDGSIQRAADLLPGSSPAQPVLLPARLGDGYVFYVADANGTSLWRADDWTGKLSPLGRLDLRAARVEAGFDRLYVVLEETGEVVALDPRTGQALELGPLPPSPTYRALEFADAWLGAAEVPLRGLLVTFDGGSSWRPSGLGTVSSLAAVEGRIVIGATGGPYALDAAGHLREVNLESGADPLFEDALSKLGSAAEASDAAAQAPAEARGRASGPLGRRPLRSAVLHGWPDTPTTAVVVAHGALGRVRLEDGKPLVARAGVVPAGESCDALSLGEGFGFVCGREGSGTTVYAFDPPLGLRPVLSFPEPRFVSSSGNGALVVRGGCGPTDSSHADARAYCVRSRRGATSEILVRGDLGVERVVALADERVAVVVPFRLGAPGRLTLVDRDRKSRTVQLELVGMDPPTRRLVQRGLWLDGLEQATADELGGWVVGAESFVGVRVRLDGKVRAGAPAEEPDRALLSGRYGLVVPRAGSAQQTVDGGQNWQPGGLPWDLEESRPPSAPDERGCSPVGCAMGAWVRVGWRGKRAGTEPLAQADIPRETVVRAAAGGRWRVRCVPTGETTVATTPTGAARTGWGPFLGTPAPARATGDVGLDRGLENLEVWLHAYLWGARGADWRLGGQWLVRAADRFAVHHAVWSTRPTRSPWPDENTAATAFGKTTYGAVASSWRAAFDPGGKAAALIAGSDLFLLEAGRAIVRVKDPTAVGLTEAAGAVKLGDQWYLGSESGSFTILRVDGDHVSVLGTYPLFGERQRRGAVTATLVRSRAGDSLGIWVRSNKLRGSQSHWYVYPVDVTSGTVDEPLELGPTELGTLPPPCGEGDDGWLLEGSPAVAPYVEFSGGGPSAWRLQARLLVSPVGLCLDALAADAQADLPGQLVRASDAGSPASGWVPLALAAHGDPAKRWGMRCTR